MNEGFDPAAWHATWRGTHYDLETGQIVFAGNPPHYAIAHEEAHRTQHRQRTLLFRLWQSRIRVPLVRRLAHLLLELDADRRAREVLRVWEQWDELNQLASRLSVSAAFDTFFGRCH